jgi:hypothetical protein
MRTVQRFALRQLILTMIILIGFATEESLAQAEPFSYVELSLNAHQNVATNDVFYEFFGSGYGAGAGLRTPFYIGTAEIGLQWHKYRTNLVSVPQMTAFFFYAGWGYPLRVGPVEITPGFRLGNYRMMFEMDNAFKSELDESEFTTALTARTQLALGMRASLHAEASRITVYTYNRLYYTYLGAGISYRLPTSSGLREALKK